MKPKLKPIEMTKFSGLEVDGMKYINFNFSNNFVTHRSFVFDDKVIALECRKSSQVHVGVILPHTIL
jgi:hypothetical protein